MASHDELLRLLVRAHEEYFHELMLKSDAQLPVSAWTWIGSVWKPWLSRWEMIVADGDTLSAHTISTVSKSLSDLRDQARAQGVPLPDLGEFANLGPHETMPAPSNIPAQITQETDRRFRAETGWPEGRKINPHTEQAELRRWLGIRYEVAQEFASK